jgi:hypothetical protein
MQTAPLQPVPSILSHWLTFVKGHERLILIVVGAFLLFHFYGSGLTAWVEHDKRLADASAQQVKTDQTQTQSIVDKLAADEKTWFQQNAAQQAVIVQLTNSIVQRDKTTATQIQHDATLSAVDAAQRIALQTRAQVGEVVAQNDNVILDLTTSRAVVASLDQLPTVQADLADTQKQLASETAVAANLQNNISGQEALIAAMKTQATDADKSCKVNISLLKAQARRNKFRWFGAGYVLGLVSAHFIGI